jgi:hypothetical protein
VLRSALILCAALAAGSGIAFTTSAFSAMTVTAESSFEAAASFCEGGTQTVTAVADTYVNEALLAQGTNYGTATSMNVRSETLANRRALVRFDLAALPAHCSVTGATLRLNASTAASGRTLAVVRAASAWSETGVSWSNSPGTTGTAATTASGSGWREWTVTAHVQAMYSGSNHGFVVRDASEGALLAAPSQTFATREASSNHPELVVTFG